MGELPMPIMTCEELNSVWFIKRSIEKKQRRLKDLQILAEPSAPLLDGMPHAKPVTYKVERIANLMIDCKQSIDNLNKALEQKKFDLLTRIQSLNLKELQQRVLSYHYVACMKFSEIAKLMGFTRNYIQKLHSKGLISLGLTVDEMNQCKQSH